jgi:DNA modification methylase
MEEGNLYEEGIEKLQKSREERARIIENLGCIPLSILPIDLKRNKVLHNYITEGTYEKSREKGHEKANKYGIDAFSYSGSGVRTGGLSTFPVHLAEFIVKFYTDEGDTILSPCCGHITRMTIAHLNNRNFIGYDVSEEFMLANRKVRDELLTDTLFPSEYKIDLHLQDARHMDEVPDESVDLIESSPPYWDIEFYGDEAEQLGKLKTYEGFLMGVKEIMAESYKKLKTGKFIVWIVMDFRKNGKFYTYGADCVQLMKEVGFDIHDMYVYAVGEHPLAASFITQLETQKRTAKMHEHIIVGRKI